MRDGAGARCRCLLRTVTTRPETDLTPSQWDAVIEMMKARDLIPFA
ncbi:hypothetical protein KCP74_03220 [Salmonella enterica subsp. enterica]|nr:hypothetical protein KCP74_03220 [Salmonella enterica subsp. enterica]